MIIDEIANYIIEEGIDLELGVDFFKGYLPDSPDDCVAIFDTGGAEPDRDIPTGDPTFQIIVRSSSYPTAGDLMKSIVDLLHQKMNLRVTEGGTYFYYIFLLGEAGHIGRDKKNRDEFSVNFICKIKR
jgi:hypothetical protein